LNVQRWTRWLRRGVAADAAGPPPELSLLMVCTGNICRSPSAEGVLRAKLQRAGLQRRVRVASAGTHGYHTSEPPDPRAVEHAARRGYDIAGLRARPVVPADFQQHHWLLAMDDDNLAWLQRKAPSDGQARVELLMTHALRHRGVKTVPDPYFGTGDGFERVLDLLEDACEGVVVKLQTELGPGAPHAPENSGNA